MVSPGFTLNTLTEPAGYISYHALYTGLVLVFPPQCAAVPSCSTVGLLALKPSRPTQLEDHSLGWSPGQVRVGS